MSGRPNRLDTVPGLREALATLIANGYSNRDTARTLAAEFPALEGLHRRMVGRWKKDQQVQAHIERLGRERVNQITRTIDAELERRIGDSRQRAEMPTRELIELRREMLPPPAQRHVLTRGADESAAAAELFEKLSANPELATALGMGGLPELDAGDPDVADYEDPEGV